MARMNTAVQEALWLDGFAQINGYKNPKPLLARPGHYACIWPLMFTHAIIVGKMGDDDEYEDRWCYHTYADAKAALDAWNGEGEPEGWHRHPPTGRRRDEYGVETVRP